VRLVPHRAVLPVVQLRLRVATRSEVAALAERELFGSRSSGTKLMQLLVGLGNPGARYAGNRHNIGFMAVEEIAKRYGFGSWRSRFHGRICEGMIGKVEALLLLPETLMNLSGLSVEASARNYKLSLHQITVFHDEIDLRPAYVKVKIGGGNAGHNGLRSITSHIGNDYRRVCIGVGRPPSGEPVDHYVLRNFDFAERPWLGALVSAIADSVVLLVDGAAKKFENKVRLDLVEKGFGEMLSHRSGRSERD
jgi:PTH1 family peptidyl-tRNA hydrolase